MLSCACVLVDEQPDLAPVRAVANRILDEIADRLRDQLAVSEHPHRRGGPVEAERDVAVFGDRFVHFAQFGGELVGVEPAELLAAGHARASG